MCLDHLTPPVQHIFRAADEDIEGVQLHHFLQTNHQNVSLIWRKGKQLFPISLRKLLRVHCIAVPREDEHHCLLISAVLHLLYHTPCYIVVEVGCLR